MATTSFGRSHAFLSGKACRMQRRGNVLIRCVHLACDSPEKPPKERVPLKLEARAVVVGSVYECLSKPRMARGSRLDARSSIFSASLREQRVGIQARISPKVTGNGPERSPNEALRCLEPNLEPSAPALAPTAASLDCKVAGTTAHLDSGLPRCFPPRFFRTLEPECRATRSIRSAAVCNLQLLRTFPVARKKKIASPEARCRRRALDTSGKIEIAIDDPSRPPTPQSANGAASDCIAARPTDARCRAKSAVSCGGATTASHTRADGRANEPSEPAGRVVCCTTELHVCASLAASCLAG